MPLRHEKSENECTELRDSITQRVLSRTSKRFTVQASIDSPTIWITDNVTGRQTDVALFAAFETIDALNDLFPE